MSWDFVVSCFLVLILRGNFDLDPLGSQRRKRGIVPFGTLSRGLGSRRCLWTARIQIGENGFAAPTQTPFLLAVSDAVSDRQG